MIIQKNQTFWIEFIKRKRFGKSNLKLFKINECFFNFNININRMTKIQTMMFEV
jgi:hypothetical protein